MISPVLISTHEPFVLFSPPVQLRRGSDRAALVGTWHLARVNPPHVPSLTELQHCQSEEAALLERLRKLFMYPECLPGVSQLMAHHAYVLRIVMKAASPGWLLCCGRDGSLP